MRSNWAPLALVTQLGLTLVFSIVLGLLAGRWIDSHFGTGPWGTLILALVGISAGIVGVYRLVSASIAQATGDGQQRDTEPMTHSGRDDV